MKGKCIVVMGVSGCGKSTVAKSVAEKIGAQFLEGDDFHSTHNIQKMEAGIPLNDADRKEWLKNIHSKILEITNQELNVVVSCSALKQKYRDTLRENIASILFVYLKGSFELIHGWMAKRKNHFMPVALLKSQFDTLEEPTQNETDVIAIDINTTLEKELENVFLQLKNRHYL